MADAPCVDKFVRAISLRFREVVLVPTPIKPGQRLQATVQGRLRRVVVEEVSRFVAAHWICRDMASNQMFLIAESSFAEVGAPSAEAWQKAS
jgi:hypothetical protein